MRHAVLFLLFAAGAAGAQDAGVQRALIQRDQQSAAFALQLRQSQEALKATPESRPTVESRQLWTRQRLDNLNESQLIEPRRERASLEADRRPFAYPNPIVESR